MFKICNVWKKIYPILVVIVSVYLLTQVYVSFFSIFFYTNFSYSPMMIFFYNEKNTTLKKNWDVSMYIKYTHQLRSTFNCYFPYSKGHFWQCYQLLFSIFPIINSIMVIIVCICSNSIEIVIGHNARMYSTRILAEMLLGCWITWFFFSILKILLYVAIIFIMSQILLE